MELFVSLQPHSPLGRLDFANLLIFAGLINLGQINASLHKLAGITSGKPPAAFRIP